MTALILLVSLTFAAASSLHRLLTARGLRKAHRPATLEAGSAMVARGPVNESKGPRFCERQIAFIQEAGPAGWATVGTLDERLAAERRTKMKRLGVVLEMDALLESTEDLVDYYSRRHPGTDLAELFRATLVKDVPSKLQAHGRFMARLRQLEGFASNAA